MSSYLKGLMWMDMAICNLILTGKYFSSVYQRVEKMKVISLLLEVYMHSISVVLQKTQKVHTTLIWRKYMKTNCCNEYLWSPQHTTFLQCWSMECTMTCCTEVRHYLLQLFIPDAAKTVQQNNVQCNNKDICTYCKYIILHHIINYYSEIVLDNIFTLFLICYKGK